MDKLSEILIKLGLFNPMFIDPMTAAAALKAAPEVMAGIGGVAKGVKSKLLARKQRKESDAIKTQRPKYEVKKERLENAAMYRNLIQGKDPVTARAEENVGRQVANQTAQASKYASSGADVLNMLGASQNQANQSYKDISADSATRRQSQMSAYDRANTAIADEKQKAWDYNKKDKFDEDMATKSKLQEASMKNSSAGGDAIVGGLAKTASSVGEAVAGVKGMPGADSGDFASPKGDLGGKEGPMSSKLPGKKGKMPKANAGNSKNLFKFLGKK